MNLISPFPIPVTLATKKEKRFLRTIYFVFSPSKTKLKQVLRILLLLSFLCVGLQLTAQKKHKVDPIEINAQELRILMDDFFVRFAAEVELSADSIMQGTSNPSVRREALLWKLYAIPAAQKACMQRDPFSSLIDGAVLCIQMENFFKVGNARNSFGELQHIAISNAGLLLDEIRKNANALSKDRDVSNGESLLRTYAADHPIRSIYFVRENASYLFEDYMKAEKMGFKKIARQLSADMEDLMNRINVYSDQVPKQILWHTELLTPEIVEALDLETKLDSISTIMFAKTDTLASEYFEKVELMINQSFEVVDSQRLLVMHDVSAERAIILAMIRKERLETIAALQNERALVLDYVDDEMNKAFQGIDSLTSEAMDTSFSRMDRLVSHSLSDSLAGADALMDRLFKKIYLLFGVLFVAGLLFIYLAHHIRSSKSKE